MVVSITDTFAEYHSITLQQQSTVLFSIYQNNTWTIRRLVDETIDPEYYKEDCQILRKSYKSVNVYCLLKC